MKVSFISLLTGVCFAIGLVAQSQPADLINLDETKVAPYILPDVLKTANGKVIKNSAQWNTIQRPAILSLYQKYVYGKMPGKTPGTHYKVKSVNDTALGNRAVSKQVTIFFTADTSGPQMDLLLYLPKNAKAKVPVFIGLNFYGNQSTTTDPGISVTNNWVNNNSAAVANHHAGDSSRGLQAARWPAAMLIEAGYGLATAYYGDLEPDFATGYRSGIRTALSQTLGLQPEEWSAIGAWAWGLSRMLDYLETDKAVDGKKVIVTGHSRIGKAALWAGASDTRFAAVVSNNSGEGGAALSKRNFGETILRINTSFPHWFVPAFTSFNNNAAALPVDQHMLLSLVAPRPLYVASAADDLWADPRGEFLAASAATPVYHLFNKKGIDSKKMPPVNTPVGHSVQYHRRTGKHDITAYDWEQYIRFADRFFK
ncbi:MAG: hypothetical protein WKF70_08240 [Chitinophagaceae bacterium]